MCWRHSPQGLVRERAVQRSDEYRVLGQVRKRSTVARRDRLWERSGGADCLQGSLSVGAAYITTQQLSALFDEITTPGFQSMWRSRARWEDSHVGTDRSSVGDGAFNIEVYVWQHVRLADDQSMTGAKRFGVLGGFVVTFSRAQKEDSQMLAEVVRCRTNEVADVLHEEEFDIGFSQGVPTVFDEWILEMTSSSGRELNGRSMLGEPLGVSVGCYVADQHGHAKRRAHAGHAVRRG